MTLARLFAEYQELIVGEQIYLRVKELVERLLRRRDPRIYALESHDYRDALDDVVNEFVAEVLIRERQIDYVFMVARRIEDFDRLVTHHARRFLARTRLRTVVDNLLDRSVAILRAPPFGVIEGAPPNETYGIAGVSYAVRPTSTEAAVRRAAALARAVPTDRSDATERAPRVFTSEALTSVLRILVVTIEAPVSRETLENYFAHLLTPWLPSILGAAEEASEQDQGLSPEETAVVGDTAERIIAGMSDEDRIIFAYKYVNLPDRALAGRLGLSRQSTAPRKAALMARLRDALMGLDDRIQQGVLAAIAAEVSGLEGTEFDAS